MAQNTITLPPIIVTPELPPLKPPVPTSVSVVVPPFSTRDIKVPANGEVDAFFGRKGIQQDRNTLSVVATIATIQRSTEQAFLAYLPQLPADVDMEISAGISLDGTTLLERLLAEKAVIDDLAVESISELGAVNAVANAFFGRPPLAVEIKRSAVDFVNIFQTAQHSQKVSISIYRRWSDSINASFRAKIIEEKIRILTARASELSRSIDVAQAEEDARLIAEAEEKRLMEAQETGRAKEALYKDAALFLGSVNADILVMYGEHMSKIALNMQEDISGKHIRSYAEAMGTFERVRVNPRIKLNAKDAKAVVDALKALDQATLGGNVARLGRAFGVIGKIDQANSLLNAAIVGVETNDWKPLGLEVESIAIGIGAGAVMAACMAVFFPVFATTAAGLVMASVMMAMAASFFDAERVEDINERVINKLNNS